MKTRYLLVFVFSFSFLLPLVNISAQNKNVKKTVCVDPNDASQPLFTKRKKCKKNSVAITPENASMLLGVEGEEAACTACGADMSGEWTYTPIDQSNVPGTQHAITFTQTGPDFMGSNDFHTIVGRVQGKWIRLTQTVSGEEGEGYVKLCEGSLFQVGNILLGTTVIVADTFGSSGALILRKNLAP